MELYMKILLALISALILVACDNKNVVSANDSGFISCLEPNTSWTLSYFWSGPTPVSDTCIWGYTKDTVINNVKYACITGHYAMNSETHTKYLREEDGKLLQLLDNKEIVRHDLNLNISDTIFVENGDSVIDMQVLDIDTIVENGISRKRLKIGRQTSSYHTWIEGICPIIPVLGVYDMKIKPTDQGDLISISSGGIIYKLESVSIDSTVVYSEN